MIVDKLYKLLIVFAFFDGMFINSIFTFLPTLRTLLYLLLGVLAFLKCGVRGFSINYGLKWFYFYLSIIGLVYFFEFIENGIYGFLFYKQYFFFLLYIFIFQKYEALTKKKISNLYKSIVYTAAIWSVLNFFFYFVYIPIWDFKPWVGRISMGYPTVDVISLNFALILLLLTDTGITRINKVFLVPIIVFGILVQFSGTGTVCILVVVLFSFINYLNKYKIHLKQILLIFSVLLLFSFFTNNMMTRLEREDPALYELATNTILDKFYTITGQKDKILYDTMEIREEQNKSYEKLNDSLIKKILGIGFGKCDYITEKSVYSSDTVMIESQYGINIVTIGYLGAFLFIIAFGELAWQYLLYRNEYNIVALSSLSVFFLSCFTTTTMSSFPIQLLFSFFYVIIWRNIQGYENRNRC